jgi:polar amino acid transport system substrate-binding protein
MGGQINVVSKRGQGSKFSVSMPFARGSRNINTDRLQNSNLRITICGEPSLERDAITSVLACEGAEVIELDDFNSANDYCIKHKGSTTSIWVYILAKGETDDAAALEKRFKGLPANVKPLVFSQSAQSNEEACSIVPVICRPWTREKLLHLVYNLAGLLDELPRSSNKEESNPLENFSLKGFRVLLAEDNYINQKVVELILNGFGATVDIADNGAIAVEKASNLIYDFILMDIRMPEMDGMEACMRLRASGLKTPIIALTADAMKGDRERFLQAGMNAYLAKPLMEDELADTISAILNNREIKPPHPEKTPKDLADLDLDTLTRTLAGDNNLALSFVLEFIEQTEGLIEKAKVALLEGQSDVAASVFHRISGSAFTIQAKAVATHAQDLEFILRTSPTSEQSDLITKHIRELHDAFERLKSLTEELQP